MPQMAPFMWVAFSIATNLIFMLSLVMLSYSKPLSLSLSAQSRLNKSFFLKSNMFYGL